eukprot:s3697_g2.t1
MGSLFLAQTAMPRLNLPATVKRSHAERSLDQLQTTIAFRSSLKKLPLSPRVVARGLSKPRIERLLRGEELSKPISMLSGMSDAFRPQEGSTSHSLSFPKGLGRIFLMGKTSARALTKEAVASTTQVWNAPAGTLGFTRIYRGKLRTDSDGPDRTTTAGSSTIVSFSILVELRRADRLVFFCRGSCFIIQFHSSGVCRDWQVRNSNLPHRSEELGFGLTKLGNLSLLALTSGQTHVDAPRFVPLGDIPPRGLIIHRGQSLKEPAITTFRELVKLGPALAFHEMEYICGIPSARNSCCSEVHGPLVITILHEVEEPEVVSASWAVQHRLRASAL